MLAVLLCGSADLSARIRKKPWRRPIPKPKLVCQNPVITQDFIRLFCDRRALEKQNFVIDFWGLERVENEEDLALLIEAKRLVGVPYWHPFYDVDRRLDQRTHFIRPFTLEFIENLAAAFNSFIKKTARPSLKQKKFHLLAGKKLQISALVRWREYQEKLAKRLPIGQAASEKNGYWCQSSHLAGTTFDLSLRNFDAKEICWLLAYLKEKQERWEIDAIWEINNKVLHVMVFPLPTITDRLL